MKVLIVLCAVAAVALAKPGYLGAGYLGDGYLGAGHLGAGHLGAGLLGAHLGYAGHIHAPANIVIGPGGIPLDTPEVAAARGAHAVAVAETRARDALVNGVAAHAGLGYAAHAAPAVLAAPALLGGHGLLAGHGLGYAHGHLG